MSEPDTPQSKPSRIDDVVALATMGLSLLDLYRRQRAEQSLEDAAATDAALAREMSTSDAAHLRFAAKIEAAAAS